MSEIWEAYFGSANFWRGLLSEFYSILSFEKGVKAYQSGIIVSQLVHSALLPRESLGECLETLK